MAKGEVLKILIIGDSGTGKTTLLNVHTGGTYHENELGTVGVDFKRSVYFVDGQRIDVQLWDTAGQERFRSITRAYYKGSKATCLVFDLNNKHSFVNVKYWLSEIEKYLDDTIIVLIGNKSDLPHSVTREDINGLMEQHKINTYIETSAKTGFNVNMTFQRIVELFYYSHRQQASTSTLRGGGGAIGLNKSSTLLTLTDADSAGCCK